MRLALAPHLAPQAAVIVAAAAAAEAARAANTACTDPSLDEQETLQPDTAPEKRTLAPQTTRNLCNAHAYEACASGRVGRVVSLWSDPSAEAKLMKAIIPYMMSEATAKGVNEQLS